ncbi:hypothetical protein [Cellulomonas sp. Leaf334]|uniref:hypothetical protein n=1 Tax=Cellulomonas sp. Leaf334 TaxID=1736339 RepID=UPI0006F3E482|nr:hypothetical protein [Cellulomonas sp. Leaf334]KQR17655.1 hypothetical protein ASF78_10435 [Cellulomonas sp. Leaf334]
MRDEQFQNWLEAMDPRLARFEDFLMPTSWTKGFTRESLEELEQYMLERWPDRESFQNDGDSDWIDGAMRYIGEAYLRIAGGGWYLDNRPDVAFRGQPVIRPDTIDGFPIAPANFLGVLLKRRTGHELAKVYDGQLRQVQRRRDVEGPDWEPKRLPIPGYYSEQDPGDTPERDAWAARVDERIAALRTHAGEHGTQLDLSPQSLTVLERLSQLDLTAATIDVRSADGAEVVARYASYLGAVLLQQAPGRWILRPGEPGTDPFVGHPFVKRLDENGLWRAGLVHSAVERLADQHEPGLFAKVLHAYAG